MESGTMRNQNRQLWLWGTAILFFGFGDTFTSLLVFQRGGTEANLLMSGVLTLFGRTIWGFLLIKAATVMGAVLTGRWQPRFEVVVTVAMLMMGIFLVAQNSTILLFQR